MTSICFDFDKECITFDEEIFIRQCMVRFAEIRSEHGFDDDILEAAQENPFLERQLVPVLEGCSEQGIKEIEKKLPEWEEKKRRENYWWYGCDYFDLSLRKPIDVTGGWIERMCVYYRAKCGSLFGKMELMRHYEEIIESKEQLAAAGDVEAMFFLVKAYEEGRLCVKDTAKSLSYYKKAKDTWAGDLSRQYGKWLDKAVQDSGLEMIGSMGGEYIAGVFAEEGKKNQDCKLKKEIKWLNKAIEAGDGWAAFTKANICYYGYGRWKKRKQEAYNNYLKAAQSKDSIYALELGEMCLGNGTTHTEVVLKAVEAFNR